MGHFCSLPTQAKTCFSHIALHRCRESSPHRTRVATKLESVRCLEISLVTWGPDPALYQLSAIQNRRSCPIRKNAFKNGSGSHVPGKTSRQRHLRLSNLAARTLRLVGQTLSKYGGDPCPVRRGLPAAVKCYVLKARFFRFC